MSFNLARKPYRVKSCIQSFCLKSLINKKKRFHSSTPLESHYSCKNPMDLCERTELLFGGRKSLEGD